MNLLHQLQQMVASLFKEGDGCPWILQQNWQSIAQYSLEEVYELIDAIDSGDSDAIRDELADLCLHLVIYSELAKKEGSFTWDDIVQSAINKQFQRRDLTPSSSETATEAHQYWLQQKLQQKKQQRAKLVDLPSNMPPLMQATKYHDNIRMLGCDKSSKEQFITRIEDACQQLKEQGDDLSNTQAEHYLSSLLFSCVALTRECDMEAAILLRRYNNQLKNRFDHVEALISDEGLSLDQLTAEQWRDFWHKAALARE